MMRYKITSVLITLLAGMGFIQAQTANFWTKKNDFGGGKRERAVAFAIGEFGYVATGLDTAENVLKDLWKYDPSMDSWAQMADLPGAGRRDAVGFSLGNKGYVGTGVDNEASIVGLKLKDFYEYDPATNSWIQKADFPGASGNGIYFAAGFEIDSKGYVCGGKVGPNQYSAQLWEYKPSIDQWTSRAPFPGGMRYQLTAFSIGNKGYVGLGANQDVFKKDFWAYNPGSNQWTPIADLPGSERGSATAFSIENRGFVCIGTNGGFLDDLWEYNSVTNEWSVRASFGGSERKNAVSFVLNGKAYVGTGKGYSGKKDGMEEYTPYSYVGLNESTDISFSFYPNPATDKVRIDNSNKNIESYQLMTYDGRLLKDIDANSSHEIEIALDNLARGVYILAARNSQNRIISTKKLILQ